MPDEALQYPPAQGQLYLCHCQQVQGETPNLGSQLQSKRIGCGCRIVSGLTKTGMKLEFLNIIEILRVAHAEGFLQGQEDEHLQISSPKVSEHKFQRLYLLAMDSAYKS